MDLTGQLSNLAASVERLFVLPLGQSERPVHDTHRAVPIFRQRPYERVRDALVHELTTDSSGLRLMEIHRRVEDRLGEPVSRDRFKDYVNGQSKGARALLERLGYGVYRLRR